MRKLNDLTQLELLQEVSYNSESGMFISLKNSKCRKIGDLLGTLTKRGYVVIRVLGNQYKAHRLAWLYMTGSFPKGMLDHKDTIKSNNQWSNLREATTYENAWNVGVHPKSSTGFKGVCKRKCGYEVSIQANGKRKYLGVFKTAEEAGKAYTEAAKQLHKNFFNNGRKELD